MAHPQAEAQPIKVSSLRIADYRFIIRVVMMRSNASTTPPRNGESIIHEHVIEKRIFDAVEDGEAW